MKRKITQYLSIDSSRNLKQHYQQIQLIVKSHSIIKNKSQFPKHINNFQQQQQNDLIKQRDQQFQQQNSYSASVTTSKNRYIPFTNPLVQKQEYDIRDLTYTLITAQMPVFILIAIFATLLFTRYYTIGTLIQIAITSNGKHIFWLIVVVGDRIIYFILVVKISLKSAQTKTQITLKSHWNSKQSQIDDIFSIIDQNKLRSSILRGMVPSQLAFLYIRAAPRRKFQIFAAINYIYASIQAVIYYPYFIFYTAYVGYDQQYQLDNFFNGLTFGLSSLAQLIMLILSIYLLLEGRRRKYGKILCC